MAVTATIILFSNSTKGILGSRDFTEADLDTILADAPGDLDFVDLSGGTIGPTGDADIKVLQIHPSPNSPLGKFLVDGGHFDDTSPELATDGNIHATRITAYRAKHVNLRDTSGVELGIPANPLVVLDKQANKTIQRISVDITGDNTLIPAPGAGLSIKIVAYKLQNTSGSDTTIVLKDDTFAINGQGFLLPAGGKDEFTASGVGQGEIVLTANKPLKISLSAANQLSGFIIYHTD